MATVFYDSPELRAVMRDDGVLHVVADGVATAEDVESYGSRMLKVCEDNAPILHLLDVRHLDTTDLAARWKLSELMKKQREFIKKSAVVGVDGSKRMMAQVVVKVSGRKNVRFFDNEKDATAWLLAP